MGKKNTWRGGERVRQLNPSRPTYILPGQLCSRHPRTRLFFLWVPSQRSPCVSPLTNLVVVFSVLVGGYLKIIFFPMLVRPPPFFFLFRFYIFVVFFLLSSFTMSVLCSIDVAAWVLHRSKQSRRPRDPRKQTNASIRRDSTAEREGKIIKKNKK